MRKTLSLSLSVAVAMFFGLWSTLPAVASSSQCDAVANNLVTNCGFETGDFTGWTIGGNTTNPGGNYYGVDGFDAQSGNYGAYMSQDLLGTGPTVNLSQTLSTVAGQQYQISFWLEQDTPPTTGYTHSFTAMFGTNDDAEPDADGEQSWAEWSVDGIHLHGDGGECEHAAGILV